ncbi:hypothetical protein F5148DRAFT_1199266, partial [Russula earlei]
VFSWPFWSCLNQFHGHWVFLWSWPGVAMCHYSDTGGKGIWGKQVEEELSGACLEEGKFQITCELASEILRRLAAWES